MTALGMKMMALGMTRLFDAHAHADTHAHTDADADADADEVLPRPDHGIGAASLQRAPLPCSGSVAGNRSSSLIQPRVDLLSAFVNVASIQPGWVAVTFSASPVVT